MQHELIARASEFTDRALAVGHSGRVATAAELDALAAALRQPLPGWLHTLFRDVPLIGLELGLQSWPKEPDFDGVEWLEWVSPKDTAYESVELYPGIALRPHGYVCLASQSGGSGDQYFVRLVDGDDPPLYQVFHDVQPWTDESGRLADDAARVVAASLSKLFAKAWPAASSANVVDRAGG